MNSYQLVRPDGRDSGVWACGACHRARVVVIGPGPAASASSRERAETCCVPRDCGFCGKPTERNAVGDYAPYHDACLTTARTPDLSDRSMRDPWARLLYRRMSEISEEGYAAGWLLGNEYMLWAILEGHGHRHGQCDLSDEEIEELRALAGQANGWIWTGGDDAHQPRLVSFAEWARLYADASRPESLRE